MKLKAIIIAGSLIRPVAPKCWRSCRVSSKKSFAVTVGAGHSWSRWRRSQLLQLIDVAASCANVISIILSGAARACRDSIGKRYTAVSSGDRSKPSSPQFTALGASAKITDHLPAWAEQCSADVDWTLGGVATAAPDV